MSAQSPGSELPFELPGLPVGLERFPEPSERIRRDRGERPPRRRAVRTRADLDDVRADPPADLLLVMPARRILPGDAPGLDARVPHAKRGAVHVLRRLFV